MVEWVHQRDRTLTAGLPKDDTALVRDVLGTMMERAQTMLEEEQRLGG
jgi:hypothetical protein